MLKKIKNSLIFSNEAKMLYCLLLVPFVFLFGIYCMDQSSFWLNNKFQYEKMIEYVFIYLHPKKRLEKFFILKIIRLF